MQGPEASTHAHEAGYDAYMTGAAFACLMRLYEAAASSPGQPVPSAQQQPSLDAVQHLLGRINVGRCPCCFPTSVLLHSLPRQPQSYIQDDHGCIVMGVVDFDVLRVTRKQALA